ncbi:hypothetical protein QL285_055451 [Trifolium repens]|nr:hypothetical protein QL285_055451 [Trifolium repens]
MDNVIFQLSRHKDILYENYYFNIVHTLREGNQSVDFKVKIGASFDLELLICDFPPLGPAKLLSISDQTKIQRL